MCWSCFNPSTNARDLHRGSSDGIIHREIQNTTSEANGIFQNMHYCRDVRLFTIDSVGVTSADLETTLRYHFRDCVTYKTEMCSCYMAQVFPKFVLAS